MFSRSSVVTMIDEPWIENSDDIILAGTDKASKMTPQERYEHLKSRTYYPTKQDLKNSIDESSSQESTAAYIDELWAASPEKLQALLTALKEAKGQGKYLGSFAQYADLEIED